MDKDNYLDKVELEMMREFEAKREKRRKMQDIAESLKIPYDVITNTISMERIPYIAIEDLVGHLLDETKLKELISRIRLKAFW
jgi:hypothetical protein